MNERSLLALALLGMAAPAQAMSLGALKMKCPEGETLVTADSGEQRCVAEESLSSATSTRAVDRPLSGIRIETHPYESGHHPMPPYIARVLGSGVAIVDAGASEDAGAFDLYSSYSSGAEPSARFSSDYAGDLFGWALATAGDGLAVGAPGYDLLAVYSSVDADTDYSVDDASASLLGEADSALGFAASATSDGLLATSAPNDSSGGSVYLISDAGDGWSAVEDVAAATISSGSVGAWLGYRLVVADVDGDGQDDLIASAPGADSVFLFLGDLSSLGSVSTDDADAVLTGGVDSAAGYDIAAVTDAEGAFSHLAVGAPGADSVHIVSADGLLTGGDLEDVSAVTATGDVGSGFGARVGGGVGGFAVTVPGEGVEVRSADSGEVTSVFDSGDAGFGAVLSVADVDADGALDMVAADAPESGAVTVTSVLSSELE